MQYNTILTLMYSYTVVQGYVQHKTTGVKVGLAGKLWKVMSYGTVIL
jgi:hypothetical protein